MAPKVDKRLVRFSISVVLCMVLSMFLVLACAPKLNYYDQVYQNLRSGNCQQAHHLVKQNKAGYAERNAVLYYMDEGLTAHFSGKYRESNISLEKAENKIDDLYTRSISRQTASLMINDNTIPYRGEDFEDVLLNLFMAMNYVFLGEDEEALVEARKVDNKLKVINDRYKPNEKNAYNEDAFVRFIMGLLYESQNEMNDAFISYRNSELTYETYKRLYNVGAPKVLVDKLLYSAQVMGFNEELNFCKRKYPRSKPQKPAVAKKMGEVFFLHYNGLAPRKVEDAIVTPLPDGYVLKVAIPKYESRSYRVKQAVINLKQVNGQKSYRVRTETGEDIGAIAVKNLKNRINRIRAKAIARAAAKYAATKGAESYAKKEGGEWAGLAAKMAGNIYAVATEQADLRCWELLPDKIDVGHLVVSPGTYSVSVELLDGSGNNICSLDFAEIKVKAGKKKFVPFRTLL
jgi:hypothetical protein